MNFQEKRRVRIIKIATKLFLENGFENTSMQKIADEVEIGIATMFRYYPKKELLIVEVIESVINEMVPIFEEIKNSNRNGLEKMDAILTAYINYLVSATPAPAILLENFDYYVAYNPLDKSLITHIQKVYARNWNLIELSILEGISDGSIKIKEENIADVITMMSLFGTAIKKHSFNKLLELDIFPVPSEKELYSIKKVFINFLTTS